MDSIIAVISLVLSISLAVFYLKDRRRAAFELESRYSESLLQWHGTVTDVLIRLQLADGKYTPEQRSTDLAKLSSLIEQGRFFFPNIDRDDNFGIDKPTAYKGYRNLALDFLVASFNLLHEPISKERDATIELLRRHFTSIVFEVVRPEERLEAIRRHTDRFFVVQKSFEDFLQHRDGEIIKGIWRKPNS